MNKLNQKGFALIEVLLIAFVVTAIGAGGYYVYRSNVDEDTTNEPVEVRAQSNPVESSEERDEEVDTTDTYMAPLDIEISESEKGIVTESTRNDWYTYTNEAFGFSFDYPKAYGDVKVIASYGTEVPESLMYTFYFEYICEGCERWKNPFAIPLNSPGLVEIGATDMNFGGVGTDRPLAIGNGFDKTLANFQANDVKGYLVFTEDEYHDVHTTTIEFNLTKNPNVTGIMFMTNDNTGEIANETNLKDIASTFILIN